MQRFQVKDPAGNVVGEVAQFSDGFCTVRWFSDRPPQFFEKMEWLSEKALQPNRYSLKPLDVERPTGEAKAYSFYERETELLTQLNRLGMAYMMLEEPNPLHLQMWQSSVETLRLILLSRPIARGEGWT